MAFSLPPSARELLNSGAPGHLVTTNPDGSAQASLISVGLDENDEIISAHLSDYVKLRNIRRDPRVVLSVQSSTRNALGWLEYLVVYGTAYVTEGGALDLLNRFTRRESGDPEAQFPIKEAPPGYVNHIKIERIAGIGPWTAAKS